jgi:catechol 2,3-dioxygenase-like lactoylglutathione lyase family enzyme
MATFRLLVDDVAQSVDFYSGHFGFAEMDRYGPAMAILRKDDLTLWLAGPLSSAARALPDGRKPHPGGGWARCVVETDDIAALTARLQAAGVVFRSDIITGPGGQQVLIDDPSGNPVELFQAA